MSVEIIESGEKLVTVRMWGTLSPAEHTHAQRTLSSFLQRTHDALILLSAEEFEGWAHSPEWAALSISFPLRVDSKIARMAILADARWEEELMAFLGEGHRDFPIRRFDPVQKNAAIEWLETGNEPDSA